MKRLILTISVLVLAGLSLQAEERIPGITAKGVKFGFGLATLNTNVQEFSGYESFAGGTFGLFVTYSFTPQFALQPELLFVAKGAGGGFFSGRHWRHNYLEVPVLVKWRLLRTGKLKPSIFAGPAIGFLLSAKFTTSIFGDHYDLTDVARSPEVDFVIGTAVDYRRFTLDIRYDIGMNNVYDPDKWNQVLDAEQATDYLHMRSGDYTKNRVWNFALGFRF